MADLKSCCQAESNEERNKEKGFLSGIIYGLIPHSFCIAFIVFSVIGATVASSVLSKFLLFPYFFETLIGLSLLFATISALFYLRKNAPLSLMSIKNKWKYLSVLYGTTLGINLLLFFVIFPLTANLRSNSSRSAVLSQAESSSQLVLEVQIPCSGHAPLIIDELHKVAGVGEVKFQLPNRFLINHDPSVTTEQILSLSVFRSFPAKKVE